MSHQVFISFSSKDIKLADKIYDRLEKNGITCWISSKNIPAGADYQACIVDAINQATIVVLIFSTHANSSNEIAKELSLASKKILIPTRIEDVLPQGAFQYQLSNRQFIDLFDDFDHRLDELSDRIKIALNPGTTPEFKLRKKIASWKKKSVQFAVAAGIVVLVVSGFLVSRGYQKSSSLDEIYSQTPSGQSAAIVIPKQSTGNENNVTTPNSLITETKTITTATPDTTAIQNSTTANSSTITTISAGAVQPLLLNSNSSGPALLVSDKVKGFAGMLSESRQQERATALKDMLVSLPKNLNSKEADALLNGTYQYRTVAITTIADNLMNNLNGEDVATVLGDTSQQPRLQALQAISTAGKIKKDLTANEAYKVLANSYQYRADSIALLTPYLTGNLDGSEVATVLGDSSQQARLVALKAISTGGKIKKNLTADEAYKILANTYQYRTDSIAVLTPDLAGNLGGSEVATVLGDSSQQARLVALKAISTGGKIKKNLTADEAYKILANTYQYRTDSIAVLTPDLAGNLGGSDVATVLGDSSQQARLLALTTMTKSGKVKRGLKPDEMQLILNGMFQYASNAITELTPFLAK